MTATQKSLDKLEQHTDKKTHENQQMQRQTSASETQAVPCSRTGWALITWRAALQKKAWVSRGQGAEHEAAEHACSDNC